MTDANAILEAGLQQSYAFRPTLYPSHSYLDDFNTGAAIGRAYDTGATTALQQQLLQARVDTLPLDRKYDTALRALQMEKLRAETAALPLTQQLRQLEGTARVANINDQMRERQRKADILAAPVKPFLFNPSTGGTTAPVDSDTNSPLPQADAGTPAATVPSSAPVFLPPDPLLTPRQFAPAPLLAPDETGGEGNDLAAAPPVTLAPPVRSLVATTDNTVDMGDGNGPISMEAVNGAERPALRTVTTFGRNLDGSVDGQDNGITAFGDNSRDPLARIASIPFAEARARDLAAGGPGTLAHFKTLPAPLRTLSIANPRTGQRTTAEVRELGPSENAPSGATADLTPALAREVGSTGKDPMVVGFVEPGAVGSAVATRYPTPRSAAEAQAMLNDFSQQSQAYLADPANTATAAKAAAAQRYVRAIETQVNAAVGQFNRQNPAARPGAAGAGGPKVSEDYSAVERFGDRQFIPKSATVKLPGGATVTGNYIGEKDIADEAQQAADQQAESREKQLDRLGKRIANLSGGKTTVADLLNDRGHYDSTAPVVDPVTKKQTAGGTIRPETHFFRHADGSSGALPEETYQALRRQIDPLIYGDSQPKAPAAPDSPTTVPATAAPVLAPPVPLLGQPGTVALTLGRPRVVVPPGGNASAAVLTPPVRSLSPPVSNEQQLAAATRAAGDTVGLDDEDEIRGIVAGQEAIQAQAKADAEQAAARKQREATEATLPAQTNARRDEIAPLLARARTDLENARIARQTAITDALGPEAMDMANRRIAEAYARLQSLTGQNAVLTDPGSYVLNPAGTSYTLRPEMGARGLPTPLAPANTSAGAATFALTAGPTR